VTYFSRLEYMLFKRTILKEHEAHFDQDLKTILCSAEEQNLIISI